MFTKSKLAPVGSTGNNTHPSQTFPDNASGAAIKFEITAVGATPTVTFKFQGSIDDGSVSEAVSDWFDLAVLPAASDTSLATDTKTAVGVYAYFLASTRMLVRKVRLVTSANTNVTYEAELGVR